MKTSNFILYTVKVVESGNMIEIYRYEDEKFKKEINFNEKEEKIQDEETKSDSVNKKIYNFVEDAEYKRKVQNIYRTKRKLKRLIFANVNQYKEKDKFITLTFKEFKTRDEVIYCFKQFNKRLKYNYQNCDYKYIAIIERGTQGTKRLHLHCLFFGLPFINVYTFRKHWKYGNVDMKSIDNYYDIGNYVLKYIEKTLEDGSYIPKGANFYLTSRGLKKPIEMYYDDEDLKNYLELHEDKEVVYANEYESEFTGEYEYYKLRKSDEIHKADVPMSKEYYLEHYEQIQDELEEKARAANELMELYGEDYYTYYE